MFNKKKLVYLDNAATTMTDLDVVKAMQPYFIKKYGNASSQHLIGQEAKRALEESRDTIARSIGAKREEIIFTSGGTESNNFALKGLFFANKDTGKNHIITSKIDHDCVLNTCEYLEKQGAKITYLDVDKDGFVDSSDVLKNITDKTLLVTIIHGNNEIGTIQDLKEIGKICSKKNVYFHSDACQSFTKTDLNVNKMNLDLLTLNSHKIHGPKGVGVLYVKKGTIIDPLFHGGGHEYKLRSGTENISGIVGFAKAVQLAKNSYIKHMNKIRDRLIEEILKIPGTKINGPQGNKRLCNNINICFTNIEGEAIGGFLESYGISISTGSACSSHSLEPSHVLKAIGKNHLEMNSSIRMSISKFTTDEDIDYVLENLKTTVDKLRKMSPLKL